MHGQRGRGERHAGVFLDMAHLILGIAIVILAVLSFINPEGNHMLFPLVFLLAAPKLKRSSLRPASPRALRFSSFASKPFVYMC